MPKSKEAEILTALRAQSQFRSGSLAVAELAEDAVVVTHGGKSWRIPYTSDGGGGYAFGTVEAAPGTGKGQGNAPSGAGGADTCRCPDCDYTAEHERGKPCNDLKCPECGAALTGTAKRAETARVAAQEPADGPTAAEAATTRGESFERVLTEQLDFVVFEDDDTHKADPDKGVWPVVIIEAGVNAAKRREYTERAIESAPDYAKCPVHLDHAGSEQRQQVRSVRDIAGVVTESWYHKTEDGRVQKRGMVQLFSEWAREQAKESAWRKCVGWSHVAKVGGYIGKIAGKAGEVIEAILEPQAVDIVSRAAFGGAFTEDDSGISQRLEDLTMLESLKLEDLKQNRPELVAEIKAEAQGEFQAQESETDKAKELAAREQAIKDRETNLRTTEIKAVAVEVVADKELGVIETARDGVVERVTGKLAGQDIATDKIKETVTTAVKEEVEFGQSFASKPKVSTPAGAPETDDKGGKRAALAKSIAASTR